MLTRFLYPVIFLMRSQNVGTEYELSGPTEFTPRYNVPIFGLSEFELVRCESMPSSSIPGGRRSKRIVTKKRANLVIDQSGGQKMFPCLIVDRSQEGFRLRGNFSLRRGQIVELIADDPEDSVRCEVRWVGRTGSEQEGQVGVQIVGK